MSLNYRLFPDRLRRLFGHAVQEEKNLDHWHYDMMGQTMLIRNADGDYTPAHRSLLEFFVAYKFAAELGVLASDFLELAKEQSGLNQEQSSKYTWSSYFHRQCNEKGVVNSIAPLDEFLPENFDLLVETIGKEPLRGNRANFDDQGESAIIALIINMLSSDKEMVKERLLSIIKQTRNQSLNQVGSIGGNIATILTVYDENALMGQDLHGVDLSFTRFSSANLSGCNLKFTNLNNAVFEENCLMNNTKMQGCNLENVSFSDIYFSGWIQSMPADSNRNSWQKDTWGNIFPSIVFLYPKSDNRIEFKRYKYLVDFISTVSVNDNEITVVLVEKNHSIRWQNKIRSVFILKCERNEDFVYILTIEGDEISINLRTGQSSHTQKEDSLKSWQNADLKDVIGLTNIDTYILKILGAINLLETSYNPQNDPKINHTLRNMIEEDIDMIEEDIEMEDID